MPYRWISSLLICLVYLAVGASCGSNRDEGNAGIDMRVSGDADVSFRREDGSLSTNFPKYEYKPATVQPSWEYSFYAIDTKKPLIARFTFANDDPVFITIDVWHEGPMSGVWGRFDKQDQYGKFVVYAHAGTVAEVSISRRNRLQLHMDFDGDGTIDEIRQPQDG